MFLSIGHCSPNHSIERMFNQQLRLHLLLLLQAAVGVPFAGVGVFTSVPASAFYWFCLLVLLLNSIIISNSFLTVLSFVCGRKSEYEDIKIGAVDAKYEVESPLKLLKKKKRKMKKMNPETEEYFSFPKIEPGI